MDRLYKFILFTISIFVLVGCSDGTSSESNEENSSDTLVVVDWGGAVTDARIESIFKPFEEEFNVKIEVESPTDYGKFKAMVEGGNVTWDVVNVGTVWGEQAIEQDLLEPIDYDIVDKENIIPELATDYFVGAEMYSNVIAFSTEEYPDGDHPKTWEEFWDVEKYPGARGLYNSPYETLEIALLADGVAPEDLYPLDVDRAFASLDKLEESTEVIYWDTGAQPVELLTSGSVSLTAAWNGRITDPQAEGVPVGLEYNQGALSTESWVVPKGAKNKDLAMEFINFATSAEVQAAFSESIDYSPVNEKAIELLPEEVQERLGQSAETAEVQFLTDFEWWAPNYEEITEKFQEWMLE